MTVAYTPEIRVMRWIVTILIALLFLVSPSFGVDDTVINMPPPPKPKVKTEMVEQDEVSRPEPGRLALARYARARTYTFNNYSSGYGSGYYGYYDGYGRYHPNYRSHYYGYGGLYRYGGFHHGVLLGGRPFFFGFGTVTIHRH